jgi:hypothetical protein
MTRRKLSWITGRYDYNFEEMKGANFLRREDRDDSQWTQNHLSVFVFQKNLLWTPSHPLTKTRPTKLEAAVNNY